VVSHGASRRSAWDNLAEVSMIPLVLHLVGGQGSSAASTIVRAHSALFADGVDRGGPA